MRIANTVNDSIVDGPGLRFTIFTQGCPHRCPGCHNPGTHDPSGGEEDTGYLFEAIQAKGDPAWEALLRETDVLVDGPFLLGEKTYGLPFRGSRNQRLIRVAESLQRGQVVLWESPDPLAKFPVPES